jgi:hypothetical protein
MVLLVIVGAVTIIGVIIIAAIEAMRMDEEKPPVPQQPAATSTDKKRS